MNRKIVLDTNIFLISIPKSSKYRVIFEELINGTFELIISNEILFEYIEIIEIKTNQIVSKNICELLLTLDNVTKIDVYYKWGLIVEDPDDNKFSDCAIAANADFLVSNDNHFKALETVEFPRLTLLDSDTFLEELIKVRRE